MSVKVVDRTESKIQYVQTAQSLMNFTLQTCLKLPKRLTFFISTDLVKVSQDIYKNVLLIKSLYTATNEHLRRRIELCEECIGLLDYLASMLDVVAVYFPKLKIPKSENGKSVFERWVYLITWEQNLLKALIKKDKER